MILDIEEMTLNDQSDGTHGTAHKTASGDDGFCFLRGLRWGRGGGVCVGGGGAGAKKMCCAIRGEMGCATGLCAMG